HPTGSELIIAPWTAMIQSAQPFGHYHAIFSKYKHYLRLKAVINPRNAKIPSRRRDFHVSVWKVFSEAASSDADWP
ncbi:hypothetical protein, partial [Bifidobacterium longum]|uniref:hypothetical protein n=1 Tax=Bifidobacterium longum TaxID=216816 RepID=UPI001E38F0BA